MVRRDQLLFRAWTPGSTTYCRPPDCWREPFGWPALVRLDDQGLYHPAHDTERRHCDYCYPKGAEWAGEPVDPAVVPRNSRCSGWNPLWPNTVPRPFHGPLTASWTRPGRVPRWYVWWRLWGQQEGRCATCSGPPQVIDHDHVTGLVRGLLCYECNTAEGACATDIALSRHPRECYFNSYRFNPPGASFSWYWPDPRRSGGIDGFLPHPSARFAEQPKQTLRCAPKCTAWLLRPVHDSPRWPKTTGIPRKRQDVTAATT
ncbi:endonuclease domain-containing protein [Streptomyces sp. NPDC047085]|uniref:endonuclease domain-containing protein n=1 Tax=Streptomyces sp. NPDC047085 TaxID=3155140 RepID=UPI0034095D47